MLVAISYILVLIIWSTTPLAVVISIGESGFTTAYLLRVLMALVFSLLIYLALFRKPPFSLAHRTLYAKMGLAAFSVMFLTYFGAQYIQSGWVAVLFASSTLFTSVLSKWYLGRSFSSIQLLGSLISLGGLCIIFGEAMTISSLVLIGSLSILTAALLHAFFSVYLKKLQSELDALHLNTGALFAVSPLAVLAWLLSGESMDLNLSGSAWASIVYLSCFGSIVATALYIYLLKKLEPGQVSLLTLVTPVFALLLGNLFNDEIITTKVLMGAGLVLLGLLVYNQRIFVKALLLTVRRIREGYNGLALLANLLALSLFTALLAISSAAMHEDINWILVTGFAGLFLILQWISQHCIHRLASRTNKSGQGVK